MIHGKKRNKDLFRRLTENWGYTKSEEIPLDEQMAQEETVEEGVFDANHYCIHHGGVHHNGEIAMAEAVQHVKPDANGHISHYDMKLEDGTILENVAAEDIQVTNASLAKEHQMKRDHDAMKDKDEDEELEERARGRQRGPSADPARDDDRTRPMEEAEEPEEELEEMAAQAQGAAAGAAGVPPEEEEEELAEAIDSGGEEGGGQYEEEVDDDGEQGEPELGDKPESLEEAIRRVVTKVLSDIVTK